jgi:multidrug efflux pump subunit AcrA (membrane-fusion protein)
VQVATAERGSIDNLITAEAILYPAHQADIDPKISAPVQKFYAQRGDHVRQGQLLAVLENRDLVASAQESKQLYEQAQANYQSVESATVPEDVTKAQADLESARQALSADRRVYEERQKLYSEGALAQRLVDESKVAMVQAQATFDTAQEHLRALQNVARTATIKGAQAQMQAAKAHYESAQAQASYAEIRSPISGVVADRPFYVGAMASAGTPLFTIVDISKIVARASVPVRETAHMSVGRPATITALDGKLEGKVIVVSPAVDPSTTTVEVWVEAPNPGEHAKPGVTAQISVNVGVIKDAVLVPVTALLSSDEGGDKVIIAGSDGVAHESKIETGVRNADTVQVISGVNPGQKVVVDGGLGLDDGAKIKIETAESAPSKEQ